MLIVVGLVVAYFAVGIVVTAVSMKYSVGFFDYIDDFGVDDITIALGVVMWWLIGLAGVVALLKRLVVWGVRDLYRRIR